MSPNLQCSSIRDTLHHLTSATKETGSSYLFSSSFSWGALLKTLHYIYIFFQIWPTLYILACLCRRHLSLSLQPSHLQCRRDWCIQDFTSTGTWLNSALLRTPCLQGRTVLQSIFTSVQQLGSNRGCYCSHSIAVPFSLQVFQHHW